MKAKQNEQTRQVLAAKLAYKNTNKIISNDTSPGSTRATWGMKFPPAVSAAKSPKKTQYCGTKKIECINPKSNLHKLDDIFTSWPIVEKNNQFHIATKLTKCSFKYQEIFFLCTSVVHPPECIYLNIIKQMKPWRFNPLQLSAQIPDIYLFYSPRAFSFLHIYVFSLTLPKKLTLCLDWGKWWKEKRH